MFRVELSASSFLDLISKQVTLNAAVSMFLFKSAASQEKVTQKLELWHQFTAIKFGTHLQFLTLVQCHKIVFGIDSLPLLDFFKLTKCYQTRANHDCKLYEKGCHTKLLQIQCALSLYKSLMCGITCLKTMYMQDQ